MTVSNEGKRHCGLFTVVNELGGDREGMVDRASMRAHSSCWLLDLLITTDVSILIFIELADEIAIADWITMTRVAAQINQ